MTVQQMQKYLSQLQNDRYETKVLNAILTCFVEIKQLESVVIDLQKKTNEIIKNWNSEIEGVQDAEALNNDMQEDAPQEGIIEEDTGSAAQEV